MPLYDINDRHILNILNKFYREGYFAPLSKEKDIHILYHEALLRGLKPRYKKDTIIKRANAFNKKKLHAY